MSRSPRKLACALGAFACVACAPCTFGVLQAPEDPCVLAEFSAALREWDFVIGYRRSIDFVFRPAAHNTPATTLAITRCTSSHRVIEVYVDRVACEYVRGVVLHELVHAHATCSDADHTDTGLMADPWQGISYLDPAIVTVLGSGG